MDDLISRQAAINIVIDYTRRLYELVGTPKDNEVYSYRRGLLLSIERNLKRLPSSQPEPDKRLEKIADLVDGTIDHFDRDDAMDLLYQIKEVLNER